MCVRAFVLPALFHWRIFRHELSVWSVIKDWFIIIFGVAVGAILGTVIAIMDYIEAPSS